ncbi:MAG: DUF3857 domain-containing protein [Acidobacteriota bacterium]
MHGVRLQLAVGLAGAMLSTAGFGSLLHGQAAAQSKPSYSGEAVVVEQYHTTYRFNADGTGDKTVSVKMKIQNEAGARQLSVLSFPFAADEETATIHRLVVHHSDGTSLETPASDAMSMPAPVTQQAPLYSDLKLLQIPVRGLRNGDELEYSVDFHQSKTEAPGEFWGTHTFISKQVVLEESLTLDVPVGKSVNVWSPAKKPTESTSAGRHVYVWKAAQLKPTIVKNDDDQPSTEKQDQVRPDVAWTTFQSWAEVGAWYRGLAAARAVPTDALRAQADDITRDAKTPEEQVQALYSFVSSRIRYVGVDFGIGRYQPHPAAEVLLNQYGDCKDKDTLFEALLHAKGFTSAPALVGVNVDLVKEVPSPAFFNHVITTVTLPSGMVWADTTPGVAPFRLLVAPVRDKDVLVIPASGDARLEHTPAAPPFPYQDTFEATGELTKTGDMNAKIKIQLRSDNEILVRAIAQNLAPAQWDQGTQWLARVWGFGGTTSNSSFSRADDVREPMQVSYDYARKPYGDWDNFRIVPLFPMLALPAPPKKEPEKEIDLGASRTETAITHIKLPEGFSADLPDAVHVKTPFASEDQTYKLENGELTVQRVVTVSQSKLPAKSWQDYKKFADDISLNDMQWIQLTTTATGQTGAHPPKPGVDNPRAAELITEANALERNQDWDGTLKKLDEAKKLNPNQPYLWSNYGWVAMRQGRNDEAKRDYEKELALYPDEGYVERLYAGLLYRTGDKDGARAHLKSYFDKHAEDADSALMLVSMESESGDLKEPIATLHKASQASPDNESILNALGEYLIQDHQEAEAATIAAKLMAKAGTDPMKLNNSAYLLAEANGDLTLAEQKSRASLAGLESQLAESTVAEANQQAFARTSLVIASWDTLGYILGKEKKLAEAEDYLGAAWSNGPNPTIGEHYGEVLEMEAKPAEALRIYELALPTQGPAANQPVAKELGKRSARLKAAGAHSVKAKSSEKAGAQSLQDARTFNVPMASSCTSFESATYRMQFSSSGVASVLRVSGDDLAAPVGEAIKRVKFPHLVPSQSKALILRDAVLTCSKGKKNAMLVLMPPGGIAAEQAGRN